MLLQNRRRSTTNSIYCPQGTVFALNDDELECGQRLICTVNLLPELVLGV